MEGIESTTPTTAEQILGLCSEKTVSIYKETSRNLEQASHDAQTMSSLQNLFAFATFVTLGTAAMTFWNMMVTCLFSVQTLIYPDNMNMGDTITAAYTTTSLITTTLLIVSQVLDARLLYLGAAGFTACCIALALTVNLAPGVTGIVLFHLISAVGGSCTALFESSMFGFASILPRNYVGAACFGLGLSGLVVFASWLLFSKAIFTVTVTGTKGAVWTFFLLGAAINVAGATCFFFVFRTPWAHSAKLRAQEEWKMKQQTTAFEPVNKRAKWLIFKDASQQILNVSFTLWITLMGVVQCGDFIGRYIPNIRRWVPSIIVRPDHVKYCSLSRLIFIPLFVVPFRISQTNNSTFLNAFWFQATAMFIFALSSGWICSLSSMYVPESLKDADERSQAATMYLLALLLGITIGIWMSKLLKI